MLKVVIADDEARVCRLVQMLADWDALDMEVAGTASSGLEALDLLENLMPDILITDIRMPGCGGLELIEKAKKISPNLEIVLISGYAQFEYAQTAINFDVGGYILKPIKKDVLMKTLEKLGKKCKDRAASKIIVENLREDSNKSQDLLRSRLIEDLEHKKIETLSKDQICRKYGFQVQSGFIQIFIIKMDYDQENFGLAYVNIMKEKAEEIFLQAVLPLCITGIFQFHRSAGYGIINYEKQKADQIRRALRYALNQLEAQKFIFGSVEFSLAVSKASDLVETLPLSMMEAQKALAERLVEGTGRLLEAALPALPASPVSLRKLLDKYNRTIDHIIDTLSLEEADRAIADLCEEVGQEPCIRGFELFDLVLAAGKMFSIWFHLEKESEIIRKFEENCELCGSAEKLFDCLRNFQREQITLIRERRENETIRPIRIAKQYVQQHFYEPITLEDVCAATGFSVSYFSTMFKKETGEGFSKYLTRVRIDQAKDLLQGTNLSISDICDQVGYNDLKHFTTTFKKMTSLNPGQYRKLYG